MAIISRLPQGGLEPPLVTITLTVEGAKEDNITIYDTNGTVVDTLPFGSGQTTGTIELAIPSEGVTYKFESSVAKDTETGTENYSKNVNLTNSSTSVKCMPEGALYWYGNECESVTGGWSVSGYSYSDSSVTIQEANKSNNSIQFNKSGESIMLAIGSANQISFSSGGKISVVWRKTLGAKGGTTSVNAMTSKSYSSSYVKVTDSNLEIGNTYSIASINVDKNSFIGMYDGANNTHSLEIGAILLE